MGTDIIVHAISEQKADGQLYGAQTTEHTIVEALQSITTTITPQIALVTVVLYFEHEGKAQGDRQVQSRRSIYYLFDNLRPLVRKTDVVFLHLHVLHFILLDADLQGGRIVQDRLWDALLWRIHHNPFDGEMVRPHSVTIGYSAYPSPSTTINQCIALARQERLSFISEKPMHKATARHLQIRQDLELPALAQKLGIPYLPQLPHKLPEQLQQLVNPRLAQELRCYPLGRERGRLTVAMVDPQDSAILDRLHRETGLDIFPVLTHPQELQTALEQFV